MGTKMSINEILTLQKAVRDRLSSLTQMRNQISTKERFMFGREENKIIEPQYDVKLLDKKIVGLQKFIFRSDAQIKQSNANTFIDIDVNVDTLLDPIE